MTLDGPYDEATSAGQVERGLQRSEPRSDTSTAPVEPAQLGSRAEYYEVLRATVNGADQAGETLRPEPSGWDAIAASDRPPVDAFRVSPERTTHILDGDPEPSGGGGHRPGTGRPGKTEFPASWDDEKIVGHVLDVARRPDAPPVYQNWNDRWLCSGTRDRVEVSAVVLRSGEVWTAWPEEGGPGVVRNPRKEKS